MEQANAAYRMRYYYALILAAAFAGIFIVPWFLPVTEPSTAHSYTYGFNNSAAILSVGCTLAAIFIGLAARRRTIERPSPMDAAISDAFALSSPPTGDKRLLLSGMAVISMACVFVIACYWFTPFYRWAEMGYFLARLELLILGRPIYSGFPCSYGPEMMYTPLWLYKLAAGGLSIEQAYCGTLVAHWIAGMALLAYCVRKFFQPPDRVIAYWVFALIFLNASLGLQYTPLRFVLPVATLLSIFSMVANQPGNALAAHVRIAFAAFAGSFLNFESSPEMGIAVLCSLAVYFAFLIRGPSKVFSYAFILALLGAATATLPAGPHYWDILTMFGGAGNLPILPGPAVSILLFSLFFFLPRFALFGFVSAAPAAAACISYSVLCAVLIMPALSRCDLGHIYCNGLGALLAAAGILSRLSQRRLYYCFLGALFLVFAVLGSWLFLFHITHFFDLARVARAELHAPAVGRQSGNGFVFSKYYPPAQDMSALLAYTPLAAPLGCEENVERYLLDHGEYTAIYNPSTYSDVYTLTQARREMKDIDALQNIIIPKSYLLSPNQTQAEAADQLAADIRFLRNQSLLPIFKLTPRHPFFDPVRALAAHISRNFRVVSQYQDYFIMSRNGGEGSAN
jgi:hypothetical protein